MTNSRYAVGRQYREYVNEHYRQLDEIAKAKPGYDPGLVRHWEPRPGRPQDGDAWGPWKYKRSNLTLEYVPQDGHWWYEVDLERCGTAAEMLDWIFQINGKDKDCCSVEDLGHLIVALDDLLNPQANICSFGHASRLDVAKYFSGKVEDRQIKFTPVEAPAGVLRTRVEMVAK
jgi:hypothetical protein